MSGQPIDYASILADLKAKKAALEAAIDSVFAAMAVGSLGQSGDGTGYASTGVPSSMNGEVPAGAFFSKSIPDAAKLYLEIVKKKQTSKEIAAALLKGGMESASKNFPSIVHSILDRARKAANPAFVKLGTQWGLASWYPNFVPGTAKPDNKKPEGKASKKKARSKSPSTKTERTAMPPIETASPASKKKPEKQPSANAKRIMGALLAKPGVEFGLDAIAQQTGLTVRVVGLLVNNFVRGNNPKVEKTSSGKYRAVSATKQAVA